ncbi:MAG TPA: glycosyltransferase family 4 protein [Burkholderiaceae bacterium]
MNQSVVFVLPEMLPVPAVKGGAVEHWVDEASRRMAARGAKVGVVSRPAGSPGDAAIDYVGISWTRFEQYCHGLKEKLGRRNPLRHLAKMQNVFSYGMRAARAVRAYDVIYLHNEPNVLLFLNRKPGQKIVLHMHNDHLSIRLFRPLYRRVLKKVDRVICVSEYIRRQAARHFPEHAHRFTVALNATDPETFKPHEVAPARTGPLQFDAGKRYLLYVGRLVPIKGVHVLIEAFPEILRRHPDVRLVITGSSFFQGAARTEYERELVALAEPVASSIVFTGFLPHETLKYLYAAVDIVVMPSVWQEPLGLVMLEAMASGTLLVGSSVGGVPEVIDSGRNGVLVPAGDAARLADAVCAALDDPAAMRRMEAAARETIVEKFTWERLMGEVEAAMGVSP